MEILRKVISHLHEAEAIDLTRSLIQIPSITGAEKEIGDFLTKQLDRIGLPVENLEAEEGRPNLISKKEGVSGEVGLILSGHMDTVPVETGATKPWKADPFGGDLRDGSIYGLGASDMKGGIASILLALKAVLCETNEFNRGLTILFVSDEEAGCAEGMKYVTEKKKFSGQLVMTAEPTDLHIQGWFKGRAYYELETRGKAAHSSNPTLGVNAIHHMVDIIAKIKETGFTYETHKFLGRPVVNFSTIEGGPFWNTIPDFSRSKLEVRTVPGQTGEKVKEEIIKHFDELKQRNPTLQARVNVWDGWEVKEPMELPQTNPVYTRIQRASQKAIGRQLDPGMAGIGGGDPYWLWKKFAIPALYFGPGDLQLAHKSDECINISKVVEAAKCYAAFILEFCV